MTPKEIQDNCALGPHCDCADGKVRHTFDKGGAKPWMCPNWGRSSLPCPPIVQSKQDRLHMTRQTWEKRRDRMMRAAEKKLGKVSDENEAKLYETRRNPRKHLRAKGIKT